MPTLTNYQPISKLGGFYFCLFAELPKWVLDYPTFFDFSESELIEDEEGETQ